MTAVVVTLVCGVLLATLHGPSNVNNEPAVPNSIAAPPDSNVTLSPSVPQFYDVDRPAAGGPGTIIKSEPVPGGPADVDVSRIIYNSRDNNDHEVPVSGLVIVPKRQAPAGGFPVIAYAHGTSGAGRSCGISLTPYQPNTPGWSNFYRQMLPLAREGYAVVGTDYLGMGAPGTLSYLVGKVEGQNVLDSIRAVQRFRQDVNPDLNVIWGHSQGGHSTAFAAQLAPSYAPELKIQGVAMLAPALLPALPVAVEAITNGTKPTYMTGFVMLIAASWAQTYPAKLNISELVTPAAIANMPAVATKCGEGYADPFMQGPMSSYLNRPVPAAFYDLMDLNTPSARRLSMPVVMVQGMEDTTIIPQLTLGFDKELCNNGTAVDFEIYEHDNHPGVVVASRPLIHRWIKERFAGKSAPDNCTNARVG